MPVFSLMMMEVVEMQLTLREHLPCADPTLLEIFLVQRHSN